MEDLAFLVLRGALGGLVAGHGAQKLFGAFEGPGLERTKGWLESIGLRPGRYWAMLAGGSEFGGGLLTLLGLGGPAGPLAIVGSMAMASLKVHRGKPIWGTSGGAELPVTNMAIAAALMLGGPGAFSLDRALGVKIPRWLALPGLAVVLGSVLFGLQQSAAAGEGQAPEEIAGAQLQAGEEAAHPV